MKDIVNQYKKWKEGQEADYVYDEIHDFVGGLSRGELMGVLKSWRRIMAKTYNISGENYDSLLTVNKSGIVTGATDPLEGFTGHRINTVIKRAEGKASIYNEVDTLEILKSKNPTIESLIKKFDLEEY